MQPSREVAFSAGRVVGIIISRKCCVAAVDEANQEVHLQSGEARGGCFVRLECPLCPAVNNQVVGWRWKGKEDGVEKL